MSVKLPKHVLRARRGITRVLEGRLYIRGLQCRSICSVVRTHGSSLTAQWHACPKVLSVTVVQHRAKSRKKDDKTVKDINFLVQPVAVKPYNDLDGINVGEELAGSLEKDALLRLLNQFYCRPEVKRLAAENGLDSRLFHQAYVGFRRFCVESDNLPADLHIVFSDILQEAGHVDDIFPYFLRHSMTMFPHLECMDDLRKISDLRQPANWYPEARALQRKLVYHAGPTNSGKTYHALERFMTAKSGVYCGPLRLLANEVFYKSNDSGTPCDLVTGEERRCVGEDGEQMPHVACTVEMTSVTTPYEVAVLDEIQMIRDTQRGWAWTRALLGVCAQEVHLCGEASAIDLVRHLAMVTGDVLEVRKYKRLTSLTVQKTAVGTFDNVRPGDCIVCFSKNDIYTISRQLEKRGIEFAVIYGTLPPGTKLAMAQKFNNPDNACKVMVATDAIGMGINLNIKRVIFYTLVKPFINEKGEKEMDVIQPSTALQIAGRAGRYASQFVEGEVTTFKHNELGLLSKLLNTAVEPVQQAGLHPTAEQIELFAYHLPKATLSNLIDIFVTLSQLDSDKYFMCNIDDFKFLADMIEHVPLQLRVRYVFCCAPIPKKQPFVCTMFLKFARQFSRGQQLTLEWLCRQLGWPLQSPQTIVDLVHLENVFDVLDLYLWLSYRFMDMFPDVEHIRDMQKELDQIIQTGVVNLTQLLRTAETAVSSGVMEEGEDDFEIQRKAQHSTTSRDSSYTAADVETDDDDDDEVSEQKLQRPTLSGQFQNARDEAVEQKLQKPAKSSLSAQFQNAKISRATDSNHGAAGKSFGDIQLKPGQRLTDQLVKRGLLTKDMLKRLQMELGAKDDSDDETDTSSSNKKRTE